MGGVWVLGSSLGPLIGATILLAMGNIDSSSSATKTLAEKESGDSTDDSGENEDMMNKYYSILGYTTLFFPKASRPLTTTSRSFTNTSRSDPTTSQFLTTTS